ncbi:E3 ubiquitin-protein ligase TRIM71-like [Dysidea avara]|uniref:E3 ubiquitin-protein ligase TRIM71-like n=1 Tax=Dysidea avara TaxID=196820 RepID=UPI00331A0A46
MAAKQVKKIVNSLSCPICTKLFKKPKFLPCHHSFCEQCLEKMNEDSRITCPQCRKEVIIPAGGVKEFGNAFIINHMVDQLVLKCAVEDEPEVECDECFRDKPIKAFCTYCSSFLCHCCIDYHTYSKQFQDHHLVTLMESQSNKSLAVSYSTAAPDPQQCQTIDVPKSTIIGKKVEFTIITRDNNGDRCFREGADQVSVQLEVVNNTILVTDNNDGVYVACFVPHQVGEVKVSVCVNGEQIKGSPYSVVASRDYTSLNKPSKIVNNDGRMGEPFGIGFSRNGKWAVADWSNHCVYLYDGEDQLVRKIGSSGYNSGRFDRPKGVTFDNEDHLYITDNHRVQKFTVDGDYLLQFGRYGSDDGELRAPNCLTVHNGKVYVADQDNNRISVFLTDGTFHQTIGRRKLGRPVDVVVTTNDELLVVDYDHNCVYRFTLDGGYIGRFGNGDKLCNPGGITIDQKFNSFYVTDTSNDRVVVFDRFGNLVHKFGSEGSGDGEFSYPCKIAVNKNGDIFVSDRYNKRIQIFSNY